MNTKIKLLRFWEIKTPHVLRDQRHPSNVASSSTKHHSSSVISNARECSVPFCVVCFSDTIRGSVAANFYLSFSCRMGELSSRE